LERSGKKSFNHQKIKKRSVLIKKIKSCIMNIENTKAQMRKGVLEFCILSVLRDKEAYTSEILDTLKSAKLLVVEGTVYPLLTRLKNDGLLNYRWEESTSGPPRKYYGLTEIGKTFLTELNGTWSELSGAVNIITTNKSKKS
jgi:PadR family transcriptional regulator, regulatory protein PadR